MTSKLKSSDKTVSVAVDPSPLKTTVSVGEVVVVVDANIVFSSSLLRIVVGDLFLGL